jgi:hypothetical protein
MTATVMTFQDALSSTSLRIFPTGGWNQAPYEAASLAASNAAGPIIRVRAVVNERIAAASRPINEHPWHNLPLAVAQGASTSGHKVDPGAVSITTSTAPGALVQVLTRRGAFSSTVIDPLDHPRRAARPAQAASKWTVSEEVAEQKVSQLDDWFRGSTARPSVADFDYRSQG